MVAEILHGVIYDLSNKIQKKYKVFASSWGWKSAQTILSCLRNNKMYVICEIEKHTELVNYYNIGNNDAGVK